MSARFSWKQKLVVVIAITLLGLLMVAGSSFLGLNSVSSGFSKQNAALDYNKQLLQFTNELLLNEAAGSALKADQLSQYQQQLGALVEGAEKMRVTATAFGDPRLAELAVELAQNIETYQQQRGEWLAIKQQLGFSPAEGVLKELYGIADDLEGLKFSMIDAAISDIVIGQKSYIVSGAASDEKRVVGALEVLEKMVIDMEWQTIDIGLKTAAYRKAFEQVRGLISQQQSILQSLEPLIAGIDSSVSEQSDYLENTVSVKVLNEVEEARSTAILIIVSAAVVVGLVILVSLGGIARQLNIQLEAMQRFLKQVAAGDFSRQLDVGDNDRDEFNQLRSTINQTISDISAVLIQVVNGNKSLFEVREQLEGVMQQLVSGSEQVELTTQQSSEATQQISTAVNDVAQRSQGVSETARIASQTTRQGGDIVADCVSSMSSLSDLIGSTNQEVDRLGESGKRMMGIIDVINGLADQTNLLALNAAIESARAGEAGRGFSVVADEVRALAQKTVNATNSISDIIKGFNDQSRRMSELMEQGLKLAESGQSNAHNASSSFTQIEQAIEKVAAEMDQVVVAVEEISYNTGDIANQVDSICQQSNETRNSRLTMESYTQQLSAQTDTLEQVTGRFILQK